MNTTVYFISDLHLGLQNKEAEEIKELKLIQFLDYINKTGNKLFILGDLFDYWFEYKYVLQKGYFNIFTKFKQLTDNGVEIVYLIGNHDFFHNNFFESYLNVKVVKAEYELNYENKRFFLGHGDGLVKKDTGYKILKKILRNRLFQFLFYLIHPDLGISVAKNTSKTSREYTEYKDYGETDGLFETAKIKIDMGYDFVLFGHSHIRDNKTYKGGQYLNLGTWLNKPCYAKYENNKLELINW
ncbi:MAG TPA: UDP-2,3-diacylglucosamine diphosphatase [Melioribacteraceae bacterium]|nr:UDP-2,3-diacylglucosamine diphosphatase [Melioribacteraceae bacterium]